MSGEADSDKARSAQRKTGKAHAKTCPVCGRASAARFRPFCCSRCADIDLGRWLKGTYNIPTDETPGDESGEHDEDDDGI